MYNLQGDVIGLADAATGKVIAKYLYDAWGKGTRCGWLLDYP